MAEVAPKARTYSREGYTPEWLALEDATGGRYFMNGDLETEVPVFDQTFAAISQAWPKLEEHLDVSDETMEVAPQSLPIRIYKPQSEKPLPLMLYFHGGGYFAGTLDTEDAHCRIFAAKTPCLVVSVSYPLFPPNKLNTIIDAGVKAVAWAQSSSSRLGADQSRIILCGGSAGAQLSSQVAYHFVSAGDQSAVAGCVLLFPCVANWDYDGPHKDKYTAWKEHGAGRVPIISQALAERMWPQYGCVNKSPKHFPLYADDLSKFPPCYIMCAEKDCFRDDGFVLDQRLRESGVRSKLDYYPALPHYFHMFPQLQVAHEMMAKAVEGCRFVLGNV